MTRANATPTPSVFRATSDSASTTTTGFKKPIISDTSVSDDVVTGGFSALLSAPVRRYAPTLWTGSIALRTHNADSSRFKNDGSKAALLMARHYAGRLVVDPEAEVPAELDSEFKFYQLLDKLERLLDTEHPSNMDLWHIAKKEHLLRMVLTFVGKNTEIPDVRKFWERFGIRILIIQHQYQQILTN